uniref:Uncharacterized protein n=1 Tax=Trichuris muris TaxID=70415 RepID=A0A5S6QFP5_TRIMR
MMDEERHPVSPTFLFFLTCSFGHGRFVRLGDRRFRRRPEKAKGQVEEPRALPFVFYAVSQAASPLEFESYSRNLQSVCLRFGRAKMENRAEQRASQGRQWSVVGAQASTSSRDAPFWRRTPKAEGVGCPKPSVPQFQAVGSISEHWRSLRIIEVHFRAVPFGNATFYEAPLFNCLSPQKKWVMVSILEHLFTCILHCSPPKL